MMRAKLTVNQKRKWSLNSIDGESSDRGESETAEGPNGVNPP